MCNFLGELKGENNFRCVKLLNSFNVWDNSSAEQWVEKIIYYLKKKLRIIIHIHKYFSKFWEFILSPVQYHELVLLPQDSLSTYSIYP